MKLNGPLLKFFAVGVLLVATLILISANVTANADSQLTPTPTEFPTLNPAMPTETTLDPATPTEITLDPAMPTEAILDPATPTETSLDGMESPVINSTPQRVYQTACQMEIDDLGDNNPFTYQFSSPNAHNIASFNWNLGDGSTPSGQTVTHTYTNTGTFSVTLVCTPTTGAAITLSGSITVNSAPAASFSLTPATTLVGLPPFTISTVNTSTGGGLSYQWQILDSGMNPISTSTDRDISYSFGSYGTFWFVLSVTDGAGITSTLSQSVAFNAPPPSARFDLNPTDGTSPLIVTIQGVDLGGGPITTWSWDFGDSTTATGQTPGTHTYTLANPLVAQSFFITLNYSGPGGSGTYTREVGVYPASVPVQAAYTWQSMGNVVGGVQICFTNNSTGPVATSEWDFDGDGTYDETNNNAIVCHTYATPGQRIVRLRVWNAGNSANSTASDVVNVIQAPVAAFTILPGNVITWGDQIDLDSSSSTGTITSYAWDFNGDGTTDSTVASPTSLLLSDLGSNVIRLTVTGPGGSSWVEAIVYVARLDITCDFTGTLTVLPTAGAQAYQSVIGNVNGRTINYHWTVTGTGTSLPLSYTTNNISVDWASIGAGDFLVTLEANTVEDGASCTESKTVHRSWPVLNCQMTNNLPSPLYATGTPYTFTANVLNLSGRSATYQWFVDGVASGTGSTFSRSWSTPPGAPFTEIIRYDVTVDDGAGLTSSCYEEANVTVQPYPTPTCSLNNPFPSPLYANGQLYTFNATVGTVAGQTITEYRWYENGTLVDSGPTVTSHAWTNITDTTVLPYTRTFRVEASVTDNGGNNTSCYAERTANVVVWPALTCGIGGGSTNPIPIMPSGPNSYTYNANINLLGRTNVTYAWTWIDNAGTMSTTTAQSNTISWPSSASSAAPGTPSTFRVDVIVTNPDGTTETIGCQRTVNVQVPRLTCGLPTGDLTPVVDELNAYNPAITNTYGRSYTPLYWELQLLNGTPVTTFTGDIFSHTFDTLAAGQQYRLRYTANVTNPTDSCASNWQTLTVTGVGENFACDAFPTAGNNFSPASYSATYPYIVDMDNGNTIDLHYTWVKVGPGTTEHILATNTSTGNGLITGPAISGADLGPVGNYTLRVDVRAVNNTNSALPGYSAYTCSLSHSLVVGTLNVVYTYDDGSGGAVNNNAVSVGQSICFTNTSDTSHPPADINQLDYQWTIGGAASDNTLGLTSYGGQQLPGCITFLNPGTYSVELVGTNDYQGDTTFRRTDNHLVTFRVYGLQNITISRSSEVFAPTAMTFTATGTNITSNFTWQFINLDTGTTVASPTGATVNPYFTIAGHYRAIVSGTGPLGTTTAQVDFTLLDISQLRAAFTPSLYGGVASMQVCFTDNSIGMNIQSWNWDFGNGDTLNYTSSTIPGSICTLYTNPSTTYTVTLVVSNGILTDSASNQVRTYSLLESSSTFSITPNGGGQYCFYANLTGNVNVTGWDFGDTGTAGALDTVCHTYSSSGTFVVRMSVTNSNGETGTVIRTVVVNIGGAGNPALTANGTCSAAREATFTVSNAGAAMTTPDQITIRDLNGAVIQIDNLLLAAGGSQTFTVTNQSGSVTFSSADFRLAAATTCEYPPEIAVVAACNSGLPTFTVSNTNGPMITAQSYEVRDSGSTLITSGTFQLARGDAPVTISVPAGNNPYDTYTFASNGAIGTFQINQLCGVPDFDVAGICSRSDLFTITNTALDMPAAQPYHVTDGSGAEVLSGNFQLNNGETLTVPSGMLNPYATYTLTSSGLSGDINIVRPACERPVLAVMTTCNTFSALTITNAGSDMLIGQTFRITTSSGTDITPTNNTLQLNAYESRTIALSSDALSEGIIFESDGYSAALDATMECGTPISTRSSQPSGRSPLGGSNSLPAWDSAPTCGFSCPPFRLYHTDETGDWEIFRLDGANKSTRESIRENLSYGVGPGVVDMSPSLSPDNQWIVFSSNRDGNWEIYVASTSGDPTSVERVTYNTVAIDTDPTWGPNNYVVYETTRNGTWDLYMVDMATGQEYRLTDDASNDINPYWSADGAKLVFQSDREGDQWQIYELDLLTMTVTKLSDGTTIAVDPQYADNNAQIVYRTYTNDNANSVITVMNADGQNVRTVSDPAGNATNSVWSPGSRFIAYQSDLDGDLDIYVVEVATGLTRQITNNTIADYAPSWLCSDTRILFTSEIEGDPNIYEVDVQPLTNPAVLVEEDAEQMTFETANDIYPQDSPNEENASREGRTVLGTFGEQTTFLQPDTNITPVDLSIDDTQRQEWNEINACPAP